MEYIQTKKKQQHRRLLHLQNPNSNTNTKRRSIGQLILNRADEQARRQPKDGHGNDSNAYEQLDIIKTYLEDLGRDARAGGLSDLVGCCERVVRGKVQSPTRVP